MRALIDADILLHECSAVAEARPNGETMEDRTLKSFDFVKELFDGRVSDIVKATGSDSYTLYLTGDGNFREEVAVTKPYKGTRKEEKPYHYDNLKTYIKSLPECDFIEGMEADDAMAIDQEIAYVCITNSDEYYEAPDMSETVICTRDKDLRMVPGWHYGWECGYQPEFKIQWVDSIGSISLSNDRKKINGTGLKFFWSQMLTGDRVDNIPGLEGDGPVVAYETLKDCLTEKEMYLAVKARYEMTYPDTWREYMLEQGRLLWMVREVDDEDKPVMWEIPDYEGEAVQ